MKYERPLRRPSQMVEGVPPPKPPPHNRKPCGTAGVRKPYRPTLRRPSETARHAPRSPRRTTAKRAARRERESPIGLPCDARRELQRHAPRSPRRTTANRAARRERESPIGPPCGARRKQQGMPPEAPAAQPQTARHSGSVEENRGAHADGGTRHRASSRRLHQTISPWRGVGSRGATVGRPSPHCASPGRHSEPRPRQPHQPSACATSPSSKAPTA